jgi:hypothetical protein
MLFHVTIDHEAEACPIVTNNPENRITPAGATKAGVKLILNGFLEPALSWAKCEITPVRDMTKD